ncbi:MAG TPA: PIG-L family deacetylase [Acetobacteraceae bacterium]|nr:PIG-L family deacetylase [Acetobacteraceae bacterium]
MTDADEEANGSIIRTGDILGPDAFYGETTFGQGFLESLWRRHQARRGRLMRSLPQRLLRFIRPMVPATDVLTAMLHLPLVSVEAVTNARPLLVLAPHPDDESLGCGGLIAACCAAGHDVRVLVITDGAASHTGSARYPPSRLAALRQSETAAAMAALGLPRDRLEFLGLPDGRAPLRGGKFREVVDRVAAFAAASGIGSICTTWAHDPHRDHRAAHLLGRVAAQEVGARLLCYPVWGWTLPAYSWLPDEPVFGVRLDIADHLAAKREAIFCHASQTSGLIGDDPNGFRLDPGFIALFERTFEVFVTDQQGSGRQEIS